MTWRNGRVINNVFVPNPRTVSSANVRSRQPKEFFGDADNDAESASRDAKQLGPDAFPQFSHLTKQV